MSPKTPSRRQSGRKRLRKLSGAGTDESTEKSPSSTAEAHAESSEQRRESGSHGAVVEFGAPPVDETVLPRFSAGANQHFDDVVDVSALPPDLQRRVTSRAPFLLGLKDAVYDKHFYIEVAGLCGSGHHPNDVTEEMVPRSRWASKWGAEAIANPCSRIWLRDAESYNIRDQYELLYARVYGNKPDNGGLANFFSRAATYYLEDHQPVDWAAFALELYEKRFSNPLLNPQKLMPPCLTKQVQGLVDEFAVTLANLHVHASPQVKNLGPSYLDAFRL